MRSIFCSCLCWEDALFLCTNAVKFSKGVFMFYKKCYNEKENLVSKRRNRKMKKFMKKLSAVLIAAMLVVMTVSIPVQAKTVTQLGRVLTLYSSSARNYSSPLGTSVSANISLIGSTGKSSKVTDIKTSNKSVVTVSSKTGAKALAADNFRFIYVTAKKAGTATVSYKVNGTTYKVRITVKKYTSPFSSLKLGSSNITSKFQKSSVYTLPYAKYANKNVKLSFKGKSGWTVDAGYLEKAGKFSAGILKNNKTFKVTKKNSMVRLSAVNNKTGQSETVVVIFK